MRCYQGVHVGFEAQLSVDRLLVKLDFNEAVWIRTDNEVNFSPVNHDNFLDIVNDIGELLPIDFVHAFVVECWFEISMKDFVLVKPLSFKHFIVGYFIGIIIW